ncbi:MAG: hypothetical protein QOG63_1631 [Thermoleophilaceae bacterium]|nr:hypothetical protein [Thermoleophilaceae bacterium]
MEAGYRLAYDEVVRALSQQAAALDGLRNRAGLLLSAASVATSFLGGTALERGDLSVFTWLAVAAFLGHGVAVLHVVWPRDEPEWHLRPSYVIEFVEAGRAAPSGPLREAALQLEAIHHEARQMVDSLGVALRIATSLLSVEVAAWVMDLATGVG